MSSARASRGLFHNCGMVGIDPHRTSFRHSVRTISWDDVPALEDAPEDLDRDDGLDDARLLADELEADGVWPA